MTAGWLDDVRDPPDLAALTRMAGSIAPGSRISALTRLGGGLGAATDRFTLATPEGEPRCLILRRYPRRALEEDPNIADRSWRTLQVLTRCGAGVPAPVWADLSGEVFGTAAYVMTCIQGDSDLRPQEEMSWIRGLAGGLATLHRLRFDASDLAFLSQPAASLAESFARASRPSVRDHPLGDRIQRALAAWQPRLRKMAPVLCHGDYWAGNTLWRDGAMVATVDWDEAKIGYPGMDVGYCRMDLAMQRGQRAADDFLREYETAAGMRIPQLHVWDLLGATVAMPDPERWLPGFHELGRTDLTPAIVHGRLTAFAEDALKRSGA